MNVAKRLRLACLAVLCVSGAALPAHAQGTLRRPTPESDTTDSSGNLKRRAPDSAAEGVARGVVSMADGSIPEQLVEIYGGCGGVQRFLAIADSKGRITFNLKGLNAAAGFGVQANPCVVRASLDGFRSETKGVPDPNAKSGVKLGTIALQPLCKDPTSCASADQEVSKGQKKQFARALDEAAGQDWPKAIASLKKVTAENPAYSSAWLSLGILQQSGGDRASAEKSFLEAIRADPKFALPYIRAAALEEVQGDWKQALEHSRKAIDLDPVAFPNAYALNATANISLQNIDLAEKSAVAGLKLDTDHRYPELEYSLGIVLYSKGDIAAASKHLQTYLDQSPNGSNASGARTQLAQIQTAAAAETSPSPGGRSDSGAPAMRSAAELDVTARLIQERNTPLLTKTPTHTCLETIARGQVDTRGKLRAEETMRVDIAVSDGKEIYGSAGGKHFTNEGLASMLGYTFSTTGMFSSLARALISGNQVEIQAAGGEMLNGEAVLRYNFHSLPGVAGWSIQYGKESGRAGEDGYFLVDREGLILRRVSARAMDVPRNIKLKNMRVVIDYEPATIANRRVLLPEKGEVDVEEASGTHRLSKVFFSHCRSFEAESTVSFNADETGDQNHKEAAKPELPVGVEIAVSLAAPTSVKMASEDDVITATVDQSIVVKGREFVARGAAVEGHVHPRRGENAVTIELDRVKTRDGWAPFYARLVAVAGRGVRAAPESGRRASTADARLEDPGIPGVADLALNPDTRELPAGTRLTWKTEGLPVSAETRTPQLNTSVSLH